MRHYIYFRKLILIYDLISIQKSVLKVPKSEIGWFIQRNRVKQIGLSLGIEKNRNQENLSLETERKRMVQLFAKKPIKIERFITNTDIKRKGALLIGRRHVEGNRELVEGYPMK